MSIEWLRIAYTRHQATMSAKGDIIGNFDAEDLKVWHDG